jgi:hypothetical protein
MEICTTEIVVPEPRRLKLLPQMLKRHKLPGIDEFMAELVHELGGALCYVIHKLVNSIWNKEELPERWKESIVLPIYKKRNKEVSLL